ncbi:Uncharacterized protein putative in bacteria [Rubellimicrobium thermophilum DSM 16684]|uniref:Uncharacterized protein putative in bacteria n=1 Tax=Rubellimicrobium thermophilum DSM 16684 TaxID=1123069 RepID=S9S3B8_9RHOB|nr:translocation/assembly module TamB domain-containing protein [Rubellimicrobium thermophilum]EPX84685.1 Uncharacterized protein putative in bacteria [Rubellimicrobium thermophilum DSM 16684]
MRSTDRDAAGEVLSRAFGLDLRGDLTALLPDEAGSFFGPDAGLRVKGIRRADGSLVLTSLGLSAQAAALSGRAELTPQGWPARLELQGTIGGGEGGTPVALPGAPGTTVERVTLDIAYDRTRDEGWTARFAIRNLLAPGLGIPDLTLSGGGTIRPATDSTPGLFTARLDYAATGLAFDDADLARAIGSTVAGSLDLVRGEDGGPLRIRRLTLAGPGVEASLEGTVAGPTEGWLVQSSLLLEAADLSRFAGLAGRDLGGGGDLTIVSAIRPLDGIFDVALSGRTRDLRLGIAALDPLLAGEGGLSLAAARDERGTRINRLAIDTPALSLSARAGLASSRSDAAFDLALSDIGLLLPGLIEAPLPDLSGPGRIAGTATRDSLGQIVLETQASAPGLSLGLRAARTAGPAPDIAGPVDFALSARVADAAPYAPLLGALPVPAAFAPRGGLSVDAAGRMASDLATFDIALSAASRDFATGLARLDPLLAGQGDLFARLIRTGADSVTLDRFRLVTDRLAVTAQAAFAGGTGSASFDAQLDEASVLLPGLTGPLRLQGSAAPAADGTVALEALADLPRGEVRIDGSLAPQDGNAFSGQLLLDLPDLSPYGALIGRDIAGAVRGSVTGTLRPDLSSLALSLDAATRDLDPGSPAAARLLAGSGTVSAALSRRDDGPIRIERLAARFPNLALEASGEGEEGGRATIALNARLTDVALFAPDFPGTATARGTIATGDGGARLDLVLTGPGNIEGRVTGGIAGDRADLAATGRVPLGLLNTVIEPRRIEGLATLDLRLAGPLALDSLSGTIRTEGARLADPALRAALEGIAGSVTLSRGTAQLALGGSLADGGRISVSGPVGLTAPFRADLAIAGDGLVIRDPSLYEALLSARLGLSGPLAGGGRVAGRIDVANAEIRVPSSAVGALGDLLPVLHVDPPLPVRQTLGHADLSLTGRDRQTADAEGQGGLALDVLVSAPARIFVRGRGLDAELGGELRLSGTTRRIIPAGEFSLLRGRLSILGQRFDLTEGSATLEGDFTPVLRLAAQTRARTGTTIRVILEGPADDLDLRLESSPELPEDEVLAQLIFGRDLSSITPFQAVQLAAAVAELAGRGGGLVEELRAGAGFADLDITTDADGNTALRLGRYMTENIYTDVLVGAEESVATINLDLTPDLTVRAGVSSAGETALGLYYERDY